MTIALDPSGWFHAFVNAANGTQVKLSGKLKTITDGERTQLLASPLDIELVGPSIYPGTAAGQTVSATLTNYPASPIGSGDPTSPTIQSIDLFKDPDHAYGTFFGDIPIGYTTPDGKGGNNHQTLKVVVDGVELRDSWNPNSDQLPFDLGDG
jgi:hypothetical protein